MTLRSYARLRRPGVLSEGLLERILRGISSQRYVGTLLEKA